MNHYRGYNQRRNERIATTTNLVGGDASGADEFADKEANAGGAPLAHWLTGGQGEIRAVLGVLDGGLVHLAAGKWRGGGRRLVADGIDEAVSSYCDAHVKAASYCPYRIAWLRQVRSVKRVHVLQRSAALGRCQSGRWAYQTGRRGEGRSRGEEGEEDREGLHFSGCGVLHFCLRNLLCTK